MYVRARADGGERRRVVAAERWVHTARPTLDPGPTLHPHPHPTHNPNLDYREPNPTTLVGVNAYACARAAEARSVDQRADDDAPAAALRRRARGRRPSPKGDRLEAARLRAALNEARREDGRRGEAEGSADRGDAPRSCRLAPVLGHVNVPAACRGFRSCGSVPARNMTRSCLTLTLNREPDDRFGAVPVRRRPEDATLPQVVRRRPWRIDGRGGGGASRLIGRTLDFATEAADQ